MNGKRAIAGTALALALGLPVILPATASALPPLSENAYINERLIAAQVGDTIRKTCPAIRPRVLYVLAQAKKLESYAYGLGYTRDEVRAFIHAPAEKARVRAAADAYMQSKGVVAGDRESYCRLGRQEIADQTITGSLLSAR